MGIFDLGACEVARLPASQACKLGWIVGPGSTLPKMIFCY